MCLYSISGYNKQSRRFNPIRLVQFIACTICLALAIYLLVTLKHGAFTTTIVLAMCAAVMFFFITLFDNIAGAQGRPIFWTLWILFALLAFVLFLVGAVFLLLTNNDLPRTMLIVAGVFFIITAILFLIDFVFLLFMLKRGSSVTPRDGAYRKPSPWHDGKYRKKSCMEMCCPCCRPTRKPQKDKDCQCPPSACIYQQTPYGDVDCFPQQQQQTILYQEPVDNYYRSTACEGSCACGNQQCQCHDMSFEPCPAVRHGSYTVVSPAPVQTTPRISTTGTTTPELIYQETTGQECANKFTTTDELPPPPQRICRESSKLCSITTYGGTFPVGNRDEVPLPAPARLIRSAPKSPRPSIITLPLQDTKPPIVQQPCRKPPCSGPNTCYNYEMCAQSHGVTAPSERPQISSPTLIEEKSYAAVPPERTYSRCGLEPSPQAQPLQQTPQRMCKSAEVQVSSNRKLVSGPGHNCWCGRQHAQFQSTTPAPSHPQPSLNCHCQSPTPNYQVQQQPQGGPRVSQQLQTSPRFSQQPQTNIGSPRTLQPISEIPQKRPLETNEVQTSETRMIHASQLAGLGQSITSIQPSGVRKDAVHSA